MRPILVFSLSLDQAEQLKFTTDIVNYVLKNLVIYAVNKYFIEKSTIAKMENMKIP